MADGRETLASFPAVDEAQVQLSPDGRDVLIGLRRAAAPDGVFLARRGIDALWGLEYQAAFWDPRTFESPPRWDVDGRHVWFRFSEHWEKHALPHPDEVRLEPLDAQRLPHEQWTALAHTEGGCVVSSLMPANEARKLRDVVEKQGTTAVLIDEGLLEETLGIGDAPRWVRSELSVARATPGHAVLGRRETLLLKTGEQQLARMRELGAPPEVLHLRVAKWRAELEGARTDGWKESKRNAPSPDSLWPERLAVCASSLPPSEVSLALSFGGLNQSPRRSEHTSLMREWERDFGAVPLVLGRDWIQFSVARPPRARASYDLAYAHALYCDEGEFADGIDQARQPRWHFWWD